MIGIRSAISIRARGQWPLLEAVYMTAPRSVCRNTKKVLAERGPSIHDLEIRDSNFKQRMCVRILAARFCPSFAFRCPSNEEGAGNAGCALHPRSRVQN